MNRKRNQGITLIALVITIIVLLILAGITLGFVIGENGIIKWASNAKKEYEQAEVNEQRDLEEIYSSIQIAGDSKVTLTMEELESVINQKVDAKLNDILETKDITSALHLNETYVSKRGTFKVTKSGNTIVLTAYLNILQDIPGEAVLITIDEEYRPPVGAFFSATINNALIRYIKVKTEGEIIMGGNVSKGNGTPTMSINLTWQI